MEHPAAVSPPGSEADDAGGTPRRESALVFRGGARSGGRDGRIRRARRSAPGPSCWWRIRFRSEQQGCAKLAMRSLSRSWPVRRGTSSSTKIISA